MTIGETSPGTLTHKAFPLTPLLTHPLLNTSLDSWNSQDDSYKPTQTNKNNSPQTLCNYILEIYAPVEPQYVFLHENPFSSLTMITSVNAG